MFGNKKMYKKGLTDAMAAYEDFGKKQEEAVAKIRSEVQEGNARLEDALSNAMRNMGEEFSGLYGYLNDTERAAIYHLTETLDIKNLTEEEQRLLLAVLFQLADDEGPDFNNNQRTYLLSVQQYTGINSPQTHLDDYSVIGDIESVLTQKTFLQTILEFFYLQDSNLLSDQQEEFLREFAVSERQAMAIEREVSRLYNFLGPKGIAEKYGKIDVNAETNIDLPISISIDQFQKKENLPVSYECAQVFFKDEILYDEDLRYVESSSYILFAGNNCIICMDKTSGVQYIMIDMIEDPVNYLKDEQIAAFSDIAYYLLENDLYLYNLETKESRFVLHIDEKYDDEGRKYYLSIIRVCDFSNIIIHTGIGFSGGYYAVNINEGLASEKRIATFFGEFFPIDDNVYYIDHSDDIDDTYKESYLLKRYNLATGLTTNVSEPFEKIKWKSKYDMIDINMQGVYDHYYYIIFEYSNASTMDSRAGFDCYYFDLNKPKPVTPNRFKIWSSNVYQIEQYAQYLIYINAKENYALVKHDFLSDKKTILLKGYGTSEKATISDKLTLGIEYFQQPEKYMRLGNWLWICKEDSVNPRLIPLIE